MKLSLLLVAAAFVSIVNADFSLDPALLADGSVIIDKTNRRFYDMTTKNGNTWMDTRSVNPAAYKQSIHYDMLNDYDVEKIVFDASNYAIVEAMFTVREVVHEQGIQCGGRVNIAAQQVVEIQCPRGATGRYLVIEVDCFNCRVKYDDVKIYGKKVDYPSRVEISLGRPAYSPKVPNNVVYFATSTDATRLGETDGWWFKSVATDDQFWYQVDLKNVAQVDEVVIYHWMWPTAPAPINPMNVDVIPANDIAGIRCGVVPGRTGAPIIVPCPSTAVGQFVRVTAQSGKWGGFCHIDVFGDIVGSGWNDVLVGNLVFTGKFQNIQLTTNGRAMPDNNAFCMPATINDYVGVELFATHIIRNIKIIRRGAPKGEVVGFVKARNTDTGASCGSSLDANPDLWCNYASGKIVQVKISGATSQLICGIQAFGQRADGKVLLDVGQGKPAYQKDQDGSLLSSMWRAQQPLVGNGNYDWNNGVFCNRHGGNKIDYWWVYLQEVYTVHYVQAMSNWARNGAGGLASVKVFVNNGSPDAHDKECGNGLNGGNMASNNALCPRNTKGDYVRLESGKDVQMHLCQVHVYALI